MAGRWDQQDAWDDVDDSDQDDAAEGGSPSQRTPGRSSYQQRTPGSSSYQQRAYRPNTPNASYQPPRPYQSPYPSSSWGSASARARVPARVQAQQQPKRQDMAPIIGGIISLIAVVGVVGLLAHNQILALLHRTHAAPNTPALVLPAFSDWRVAYAGQDGQLHAVSLDGQTDVSGASLPALGPADVAATATTMGGGASPDGRYLAYVGGSGAVVLHLTAHAGDADAIRSGSAVPSTWLWSPDSSQLAWLETNSAVHVTSVAALTDAVVPSTTGQGIQEILGWMDASHLAVRVDKANATSEVVAALDASSGQQRVIVTFPKPGYGALHYRLSPDGARFLVWNSPIKGQPFTQIFRNYDTKTGAVRKLPNSLKAIGANISAVAWKPGAAVAAVATGSEATHDLKLWLVDAAADGATSIGVAYPLGWLTDGSQLIGSSASVGAVGGGPYTISAFTFPSSGASVRVTLTDKAMTFPWLGLVRTG